jgi:hypothetical protein
MVSSPGFIPGTAQDPLAVRVAALERSMANVGRKTLDSSSITDPVTGAVLFGTDPDAEYGMAFPGMPAPMYPAQAGFFFFSPTTNNTDILIWQGILPVINPAFECQYSVNAEGGTNTITAYSYMEIVDLNTGWFHSFPAVTASCPPGGANVNRSAVVACQIPNDEVGQYLSVFCWAGLSAGAATSGSNSCTGSPLLAQGCSWATAQPNLA